MARPKKSATKPTTAPRNNFPARSENRERNRQDDRQGNPNRIGALWINRKGQNTFMSGEIELPETGEKIRILVFKNTYKERDNQPDYNILLPREESRRDSGRGITDDDIPF